MRIDAHTDAVLSDLARERHEDKKKVLEHSVEMLRRQSLLDGLCDAYRELRDDPESLAKEQPERAAWQSAALSGLKDE